MKRNVALSYILAVVIFLSGCEGSTNLSDDGEIRIIQEEKHYATETVLLPEYASINAAWADKENIYYIASELPSVSGKPTVACFRLKPGVAEPEWLYDLDLTENQNVISLTCDANGKFYLLGYQTEQTTGGSPVLPEGILWQVDSQGTILRVLPLAEIIGKGNDSVPTWQAVDSEGRIFLSTQQDILVLDSVGQLLFETRAAGQILGMVSQHGRVLVEYMDIDGIRFNEIDVQAKNLVAVPEYEMPGGPFHMMVAGNESLMLADSDGVYQYESENGQLFKKFDWMSHDYTGPANGDYIVPYEKNGIAVISRNQSVGSVKAEMIAFRELTEGETAIPPAEKTVITLGYDYRQSGFHHNMAVTEFNKNNPEYRIEVKYYDEDIDRLYADIISGNGPDVLLTNMVVGSHVLEPLAQKGALEDLYSYIDGDESLSRSDFFENILEAYETQGSLCVMPIWYRIRSVVAPTSLVGERTGWNLEEFFDFTQSLPEEQVIFDAGSQKAVLRLLRYAYTGQLANPGIENENTVPKEPISRELLTKILTYANQYEDDENYHYNEAVMSRVQEGEVQLLQIRIREGNDYNGLCQSFGEPVTLIGYPTPVGNGNLVEAVETFAINASSEHKEAAWQFLSQLLSKESLEWVHDSHDMYRGFYIRKDMLDHHFAKLSNTFQGSGQAAYWMKGDNQTGIAGKMIWYPFDERVVADFERVRELILSVDAAYRPIKEVDAIIEEEAEYYFNGTKPLDEVVDVIENRVQTYINEMK